MAKTKLVFLLSMKHLDHTVLGINCLTDFTHIKQMVGQAELFANMWLPFGLMPTVQEIKEYVGDNTSIDKPNI